ncbi:MAG: beta-propeller domain-containing protein [Chitinophagaceae bacterium]|nr:beta-propeller domain-containing protein [Oligoflexus sp.]
MKRHNLVTTTLLMSLCFSQLEGCGVAKSIFKSNAPVMGGASNSGGKYGTPFALLDAQKMAMTAPNVNSGLKSYGSCDELKADLDASLSAKWLQDKAEMATNIQNQLISDETPQRDAYSQFEGNIASSAVEDSAPTSTSASSPVATATSDTKEDSQTNVQEKGVDEADSFRVGVDQIFAISFDNLQVIDRATLTVQGAMPVAKGAQLYTSGHKLVVIEALANPVDTPLSRATPVVDSVEGGPMQVAGKMNVRIYTTAAGKMPVLVRTQEIAGQYVDSRLIANQLILVANDTMEFVSEPVQWSDFSKEVWYANSHAKVLFDMMYRGSKRDASIVIKAKTVSGIACTAIAQRKVTDFDWSLAKMVSLNIDEASEPKAIGMIGQGEEIYVTSDSVYLLKSKLDWFSMSGFRSYNWAATPDERVFIRQVSISATGELAAAAEGEVKGHIKDCWALHSVNAGKNLVVTTSTGSLFEHSGPNVAQNQLSVLEKDDATKSLQVVAGIENFGTTEDIRAVRYVGDKVYVVTFKKTDPLYAFDLSDIHQPKLLSGLKIPGFSTYMHPLADGRLLGVGFDAQDEGDFAWYRGVQVSLFDTSNPLEMNRMDNHIYGTRGSSSGVTSNHHAFFYNETSHLIGLPLIELSGNVLNSESTQLNFSGAQILFFETDKLIDKGRISHADFMPAKCASRQNSVGWWSQGGASADINRLYQIDGRLLTLSGFGLKAYALDNFTTPVASQKFANLSNRCI